MTYVQAWDATHFIDCPVQLWRAVALKNDFQSRGVEMSLSSWAPVVEVSFIF